MMGGGYPCIISFLAICLLTHYRIGGNDTTFYKTKPSNNLEIAVTLLFSIRSISTTPCTDDVFVHFLCLYWHY